jgi:hypothetical protein
MNKIFRKLFLAVVAFAFFFLAAHLTATPDAQERSVPGVTPQQLANPAPPRTPRPQLVPESAATSQEVNSGVPETAETNEMDGENLPFGLQETGDGFHGDEVNAAAGQTWLGLFTSGNGFYLRRTKIAVSMVNDPIADDENEQTGKSVATDIRDKSVFLLKRADFLREGPIKTVFFAPDINESTTELANGTIKKFSFGGKSYELMVANDVSKEKFLGSGAKLLLKSGDKVQMLRDLKEGCDDCYWNLYWVGDLDRDGKLDFYLDLSNHYNVTDKRLFLSSRAKTGELVGYVANFSTVGC